MRKYLIGFLVFVLFIGLVAANSWAVTEIQFWHAMAGPNGEKLTEIATNFNNSQSDFKIVPVHKGNYDETLTAGIAAFRSQKQPHILQVSAAGTQTVMMAAAKGVFKSVSKLMEETGEPFNKSTYLESVIGFFVDPKGEMLSLPFNCSTTILFYNKEAFQKVGLNPDLPPKTWPELAEAAKKCVSAGYVGFTSAWQSWVMLENLAAWHNLPFATKQNGFGGLDTQLVFNDEFRINHIQKMVDWQKDKIFKYGGRQGKSTSMFTSGECAIFFHSSAALGAIRSAAKFDFGTGMLPFWPSVPGAPQNSILGGASLWIMSGLPAQDYKGVAKFISYLSSPEVQAEWHQFTGYLPSTMAAYELTKKQGYYDKNPGTDTAILQMTLNKPTENSKGIRIGGFLEIRNIINEQLESAWAGKKSAKEALDTAVSKGNEVLRAFEKSNM